ncbi:MAG: DUF2961 domain-containing protein [Deltaproteobacteria bacterium]|nr:DUF2961 domain-containing protein [Deltaproteobacteria bacterium]
MPLHRLLTTVGLFALALCISTPAHARKRAPTPPPPAMAPATDSLGALAQPQSGTFGRVSSSDLEAEPVLEAGGSIVLAELDGPGTVDRIWIAIEGSETYWRDIVLRIRWEDSDVAAVEAPIGDFFAVGPGARQNLSSLPMVVQSGGRSFTSFWAMPFASRASITLDNEGVHATRVLAWEVDYNNAPVGPAPLHFHATYSQSVGEASEKPLTALRTTGAGHYVGLSVVVQATEPGNVAAGRVGFTVDGDARGGAGSEKLLRYFGNMFGVNAHSNPYSGATLAEGGRAKARTSMYRFHVQDPIPFAQSIELTVERGPDNSRSDRLSTVAYWYQGGVATPSTKLASARDRRWTAPSDDELRLWARADEIDDEIVEAYRASDLDGARTLLEELLKLEPANAIASYNLACLYALGDEQDKALHMLQQAVDLGFSELSYARHDPDLASLHEHERFKKLVGLQ